MYSKYNSTFVAGGKHSERFTNLRVILALRSGEFSLLSQVRKRAVQGVQRRGGDIHDTTEVLSEYEMQFGAFRGQTFKWVIENALGYAGYLVDDMRNETTTSTPLSQNKASRRILFK